MSKLSISFFCLLLCVSCSKKILPESAELTVSVETHTITAFAIIKNSKYLILFESGLGDDHKVWNRSKIVTSISAMEDVVAYDRAGYGKSHKGLAPRNIEKLSSELDSVINKFAKGRRVILVGHSLGGLIIRDYAIKNPSKLAGILFIDPSHEAYNHPTQTQENLVALLLGVKNKGAKMEAMQLMEDMSYMETVPNLPNVPVIVLTSMKEDDNNVKADQANKGTRKDWYDAHESLRKGVSDFTHISTTKSGHYIFLEEPNLVLDNLKLLISKLP